VVGFIKNNFAKHRVFMKLDTWNQQGWEWLHRTGNGRIHNTTKKCCIILANLETITITLNKDKADAINFTLTPDNLTAYAKVSML
jgi:hypothetical protein